LLAIVSRGGKKTAATAIATATIMMNAWNQEKRKMR